VCTQVGIAILFGARFDLAFASIKEGLESLSKPKPSPGEGHTEL
jgi:hypothetical protein